MKSKRQTIVTKATMRRAIEVARAMGAKAVECRPDGGVLISFVDPAPHLNAAPPLAPALEPPGRLVL
jgi:hypothetical protein